MTNPSEVTLYASKVSESHIRTSKGEEATIYVAQVGETGRVKIGSAVDVERRLMWLRSKEPGLVLRRTLPGGVKWERQIHQALRPWRIKGEWYRPAPEVTVLFDMPEAEVRPWALEQKSAVADSQSRHVSGRAWRTFGDNTSRTAQYL